MKQNNCGPDPADNENKYRKNIIFMKVIGITGGVGCGKSAVMDFLAGEYGAEILKADSVGHLLMEPGMVCYEKMVKHFGEKILRADGTVDRQAVASIVFSDEKELAVQNRIMHPEIRRYILQRLEEVRAGGTKYCFVEAALFFEDHYDDFCDEVWYIYADAAVRKKRLAESRGYSERKIQEIMEQQMTEEEFRRRTSFTVDNSGSLQNTEQQIRERMQKL